MGKFAPPPLPRQISGFTRPVGKEQKRRLGRRLLAHEQQRNMRAEKHQSHCEFQFLEADQARQPLTQSAIAYLIVVLSKENRRFRRKMAARLAPRLAAQRKRLALISKLFGQRPYQMFGRPLRKTAVKHPSL